MKGLNNPIGMKSLEPSQSPFIMNPFRFGGGGAVGGWVELGRTTLGSAGNIIDVSSFQIKDIITNLMGVFSNLSTKEKLGFSHSSRDN
jgi:hypothetical protein